MGPTVAALSKEFEEFKNTVETKLLDLSRALESVKLSVVTCNPADVRKLENEVVELKKSMDFINKEFEAAKTANATLAAKNKKLEENNDTLMRKVAQLEQYSRLNNLEIKGVPVTQGEDCEKIVACLGDKIGCPLKPEDIDTVHRIPTRNSTQKNIVLRFCSRNKRSEYLSKARNGRPKTTDLGFTASQEAPIYVNEHLTPDNKRLFSKALDLKKQHKWMFVWTDRCIIKARKTLDGPVYRLACESDLRCFSL